MKDNQNREGKKTQREKTQKFKRQDKTKTNTRENDPKTTHRQREDKNKTKNKTLFFKIQLAHQIPPLALAHSKPTPQHLTTLP